MWRARSTLEPAWSALASPQLPRVSIAHSGSGVELRLTTEPGAWYDLEISSDLRSWQRAGSYQTDGADKVIDITPVSGLPLKRFYRAVNRGHRY